MSRYREAHKSCNGPGDARPTAIQVLKDEDMLGKLTGRVAIVTGGSSGIGIETARALHEGDAHVYLAVRDVAKGKEVAEKIQTSGQSKAAIDVLKLELDSLESVRSFAKEFQDTSKTLNLLINNAGHRSAGIQFDDLDFKKQGYNTWKAYGQSKTANIYMANEIERRYGSQGLHATAVHPGGIETNLGRHLDPNAMKGFKENEGLRKMMKSPEQGAATTIWAAVSKEWANKGGAYLEECQVSEPVTKEEGLTPLDSGYKAYIYDEAAYRRLWNVSNKLVGLPEDE